MDAASDWVSPPPTDPDHGVGCVAVSAILHAALFGMVLLLPPGDDVFAIDELFDPSAPPVLISVRALVPTAPSGSVGRGGGRDGEVGRTIPSVSEAGVRPSRMRARGGRASHGPSSLSLLAALAGQLSANVGHAPAFVAEEALAGPRTGAPAVADGLDMIGVGRGSGAGQGDTIGAPSADAWGLGASSVTCSEGELERRTLLVGRIVALASCSASLNRGAMSARGSSFMSGVGHFSPPPIEHAPIVHCGRSPGCGSEVRGALAREVVRRVVQRHRAEVRGCYERALATRPDLEGRVTAEWVIAPSGAVQRSSVNAARTDVRSPDVEACITSAVARWTFPSSSAPTVVSYPFVLGTDG